MTFKHTPGPWQAKNEYQWSEIIGDIDGPDAGQLHYTHVCSVDMHDLRTDGQRANARLIAAAPDLLEALEEMVRWYAKRETASMCVSGGEGFLPIEVQDEEVQRAMRAIAKATGEQQ